MVKFRSSTNNTRLKLPKRSRKYLITRSILIGFLSIIIYIVVNYTIAWFDSYRLGKRLLSEAGNAYARGDYLGALDGYEERDEVTGRSVQKGGFTQIVLLWGDKYAWPLPEIQISQAENKVDEIIQKRLTIAEAELFIQENTGIYNPYFGDIFLRLGELYEEKGDRDHALSIYRDAVELFPDRPDIIEKAKINLYRLEGEI